MQFKEEWMSSGLCSKDTVCHGVTQQELEATDHMIHRKQRARNVYAQLIFFFLHNLEPKNDMACF